MNKIFLIGNLTRDPELRSTQMGVSVCSFAIAVNRRHRNAEGKSETDFFTCSAWRLLGENCAKYLKKGSKVAVTGAIQSRSYQAADGSKRIVFDIVADEVEFLSPAQGSQEEGCHPAPPVHEESGYIEVDDDELPF